MLHDGRILRINSCTPVGTFAAHASVACETPGPNSNEFVNDDMDKAVKTDANATTRIRLLRAANRRLWAKVIKSHISTLRASKHEYGKSLRPLRARVPMWIWGPVVLPGKGFRTSSSPLPAPHRAAQHRSLSAVAALA
jgi:hypothetical protein